LFESLQSSSSPADRSGKANNPIVHGLTPLSLFVADGNPTEMTSGIPLEINLLLRRARAASTCGILVQLD